MKIIIYFRRLKNIFILWVNLFSSFIYDFWAFYKISNVRRKRTTKDQRLGSIIGSYHVIEKGLGMPHRRLGFGIPAIKELINECMEYYELYGNDNSQFFHAVQVVFEYKTLHDNNGYELPRDINDNIHTLQTILPSLESHQETLSKEQFFKDKDSPFNVFSDSRHSTRHFEGVADKQTIIKAIELAQNAPSSCNKQPTCIHLVTNEDLVSCILDKQGGNRGFGQDIKTLIVLSTNMSCYSQIGERHSGYVDLGIYTMNLLYALHFYKLGAIPLIWLSDKKRDNWLSKELNLPYNEIPVLVVGVGCVSDNPTFLSSPRKFLNEVLTIHE